MENSGKTTNPKNKKAHGTQSLDGSPEKHVRNPKTAIFPHKKNI